MRLIKASNGRTKLNISKKEWQEIGRTAGWFGDKAKTQPSTNKYTKLGNAKILFENLGSTNPDVLQKILFAMKRLTEGDVGGYLEHKSSLQDSLSNSGKRLLSILHELDLYRTSRNKDEKYKELIKEYLSLTPIFKDEMKKFIQENEQVTDDERDYLMT
jgi:hypothetical protein